MAAHCEGSPPRAVHRPAPGLVVSRCQGVEVTSLPSAEQSKTGLEGGKASTAKDPSVFYAFQWIVTETGGKT